MSTPPSRKKMLLVLAAASIPLLAALFMLAATMLDKPHMQEAILSQLTDRLQRQISFSRANISFTPTPSFTFHDIDIRERGGETTFLSARRLTFRLSLIPLLQGRVSLGNILLDEPRMAVTREKDGTFNFSDLLAGPKGSGTVRASSLRVRHGIVVLRDHTLSPPTPPVTLEELDLSISNPRRGHSARLKLAATVKLEGKTSAVSAAGSIHIASAGQPLAESVLDLSLAGRHLDLAALWPYYRHVVPFRELGGTVDATASLDGRPGHLTIRGELAVQGGRIDFPAAFEEAVDFPPFNVDVTLVTSPGRVNITSANLTSSLVSLQGQCDISDITTGDPLIKAVATMPPFRLGPARHLIPYPIIATDVADFIRRHIRDGIFSLQEGRLHGRVSQIATMGEKDNYNVLSIRATCDKGLLVFGEAIPTFNGVSGTLELQGKDFILKGMKGLFGSSPFSLEGRIRDYPIPRPSTYPFSMVMTPRQPEVAWLLREQKTARVIIDGASTLKLSGDGQTTAYTLNGSWDLTGARYALYSRVNKPSGRPSSLAFSSILTREGIRVPSLTFALAPLTLNATAQILHKGGVPLSFTVKSAPVELQEIQSFFPSFKPFQPAGRLQATITGEARSWNLGALNLGGEASLTGITFRPRENIPALSNINGIIRFKGNTLETGQLSATMGKSTIQGKGTLKGFSSPEFSVSFKSRRIDPRDLGLQVRQQGEAILRKVGGTVTYQDGVATLKQVGATINDTSVKIGGSIRLNPQPVYDLTVTSPSLDSKDLLLLGSLQAPGPARTASPVHGRLQLTADSGTLQTVPFRKLQATVSQEGSIIYVQPLELQVLNGKASGRLRLDRTSATAPRYQASYAIERISAEQLFTLVGDSSRLITGTLSLHGELTARGNSQEDLRRSALGNVKIKFEEGVLRKYPILAKIFSILNVSQLLKLQLPDMVRNGMPYDTITASVAVKEGLMSTSDLKIDSDAINISAIGSADLIKEQVNLTVGVKPLQTVDKVVSKIPLVGWVLTGKDKTLLTAWFEVKGGWSDPQVTAIPITSLSRGVLGIFARLLELPGKIITDTGEVILGN